MLKFSTVVALTNFYSHLKFAYAYKKTHQIMAMYLISKKSVIRQVFSTYLHVRNDSEIRENYHCGCNDFFFYNENHLLRPLKRCALLNRLNISSSSPSWVSWLKLIKVKKTRQETTSLIILPQLKK